MLKKLYLILSLCLLLLLQACGQATDSAYAIMLKGLYAYSVPLVKPTTLFQMLERPQQKPLLLDTRTLSEYKVSHIKIARFVNYDTFSPKQLQEVKKSKPIVVYCSVGYRSERVAEQLKKAGFKKVKNLYGGIFEWVNKGFPIYNSEGRTNRVHAFSMEWGMWLRKGEKVYE